MKRELSPTVLFFVLRFFEKKLGKKLSAFWKKRNQKLYLGEWKIKLLVLALWKIFLYCGTSRAPSPTKRANNEENIFYFYTFWVKFLGGRRENDMLYRFRWLSTADTRFCRAEWRWENPGVNEVRRPRRSAGEHTNSQNSYLSYKIASVIAFSGGRRGTTKWWMRRHNWSFAQAPIVTFGDTSLSEGSSAVEHSSFGFYLCGSFSFYIFRVKFLRRFYAFLKKSFAKNFL